MSGFSDYNCKSGISEIALLLSRLTLFSCSEEKPLSLLKSLVGALFGSDILGAVNAHHALTSALLSCGARRVSGDIWQDYLLMLILESSHAFARSAAGGRNDESVYGAMRNDLSVLGALSTLESDDICRFILEKQQSQRGVNPHTADSIAMSAAALWSGSAVRTVPTAEKCEFILSHAVNEADILSWRYENTALEGEYVCDEILEELYHRFSTTSDWRALTEDLWSFFASQGCGDFIKYRSFLYKDGALLPLALTHDDTLLPISFYEMQHRRVLEKTISFMQGSRAENILVTGGASTGKTELVLSIFEELPELRLVVCDGKSSLAPLFEMLSSQPLRFMVLLDGIGVGEELSSFEIMRLKSVNVILCATSRGACDEGLFPIKVTMPYPSMNEFVSIVEEMLSIYDITVMSERIRSRALNAQAQQGKLTLSLAKRIADEYIAEF